ncbi:hypothetical protein C8R45DRAFT_1098256 [Mycena sanguinolenta]|nr:hypothetical protein C8R45DRAFT_1098256 [Mycena sanguinolenta]
MHTPRWIYAPRHRALPGPPYTLRTAWRAPRCALLLVPMSMHGMPFTLTTPADGRVRWNSVLLNTCLEMATAADNCPGLARVDCFCVKFPAPTQPPSSPASSEASAEALVENFCAVVATPTSLSFASFTHEAPGSSASGSSASGSSASGSSGSATASATAPPSTSATPPLLYAHSSSSPHAASR